MKKPSKDVFIRTGKELQSLRDEIGRLVQKWVAICNLEDWDSVYFDARSPSVYRIALVAQAARYCASSSFAATMNW